MATSTDADASVSGTAVEDFTVTFDFDDENHCSSGIDQALEDISDDTLRAELATALASLDNERAHDELLGRAEQRRRDLDGDLDPDEDDTYLELTEAASRLTWCRDSCSCASDNWDCDKYWFNELLSTLGAHHWAVIMDDEPASDINDTLDVDSLWSAACSGSPHRYREGWSALTLEYKAGALHVEFDGRCIPWTELVLTALTAHQAELAGKWEEAEPYDECYGARVLASDPDILQQSLDLWDELDSSEIRFRFEFGELHRAHEKARGDGGPFTDLEVAALVHLGESWTASLDELLDTARLVTVVAA